jgi:hypothetical protein
MYIWDPWDTWDTLRLFSKNKKKKKIKKKNNFYKGFLPSKYPKGPKNSYNYPNKNNIETIPYTYI